VTYALRKVPDAGTMRKRGRQAAVGRSSRADDQGGFGAASEQYERDRASSKQSVKSHEGAQKRDTQREEPEGTKRPLSRPTSLAPTACEDSFCVTAR